MASRKETLQEALNWGGLSITPRDLPWILSSTDPPNSELPTSPTHESPSSFFVFFSALRQSHLAVADLRDLEGVPRQASWEGSAGCGAFCLDVRTLTFCQLMDFQFQQLKVNLFAGEQKAAE